MQASGQEMPACSWLNLMHNLNMHLHTLYLTGCACVCLHPRLVKLVKLVKHVDVCICMFQSICRGTTQNFRVSKCWSNESRGGLNLKTAQN